MAAEQSKPPFNPVRYDKDISLLIRQTYEKQQVIFHKLHAIQVQVQELRASQDTLLRAFQLVLSLPREDADLAEKVKKEMLHQTNHAYTKPE